MLEPVRNQFIVEIANRYTISGWDVIYLVANAWRGAEVEETGIQAEIISTGPNWEALVAKKCRYIEEEGSRPLIVTEAPARESLASHKAQDPLLVIPRAVTTLNPVQCPRCNKKVFFGWSPLQGRLYLQCHPHGGWAQPVHPVIRPPKGQGLGKLSSHERPPSHKYRHWTAEQETLARELLSQGMTYAHVGERMGRSRNSIRMFIKKGGMEGTRTRQKCRTHLDQFDI